VFVGCACAEDSGEIKAIKAGKLQVESEPAGASLFINGRLVGITPLLFEKVPSGGYRLRFEKEGCQPLSRNVELGERGVALKQKLAELATGALTVNLEPKGAEVLLNGELMGQTPLALPKVPVGGYELLVRKPNFESYCKQIKVEAGAPLVFEGFGLRDKILTMLENLVKSEPQRVANYLDLGQYLFVNGKKEAALEVFTRGRDAMQKPLDFNGAGYAGKDKLSPEEQAFEVEQRDRDLKRFRGEMGHPRYEGATQFLRR
jgi:hypothetical protein